MFILLLNYCSFFRLQQTFLKILCIFTVFHGLLFFDFKKWRVLCVEYMRRNGLYCLLMVLELNVHI